MLQVVVKIYQGILDEVKIYSSEAEAKADFEKYTGVTFEDYSKRLCYPFDESSDEILGDTEGTEILEIDFKEGLWIPEEDIVQKLRDKLEREPNPEEVCKFKAYLDVDVAQWLTDNARCFCRDQVEAEIKEMFEDNMKLMEQMKQEAKLRTKEDFKKEINELMSERFFDEPFISDEELRKRLSVQEPEIDALRDALRELEKEGKIKFQASGS